MILTVFGLCLLGYVLGSIPFAYLACRYIHKLDIRRHGSGNVGFANVVRAVGWRTGLPVLLGDLAKGFVPVLLAQQVQGFAENWPPLLVGMAAIAGHVWPCTLRFKGGKGVATAAGVFAGLAPIPFVIGLATYVIVLLAFGYSSLGSMTGAVVIPVVLIVQKVVPGGVDPYPGKVILAVLASVVVIVLHRSNIRRLKAGTERKLLRRRDKT